MSRLTVQNKGGNAMATKKRTARAAKSSTRRTVKRTVRRTAAKRTAVKRTARAVARPKGPRIGWWEITLADKASSDKVKRFFTQVFGWKIESDPQYDYGQVSEKDAGIGGGIGPSQAGKNNVTFYIEVQDIDGYLRKIEAAGGKMIVPPTPISPTTTFAQFADPAGNLVGLYRGMGSAD